MEATRPHLSFPAEWITATVFLAATLAVGSLIIAELRVSPRASSAGTAAPAAAESTIPADAVAVPKLMLGPGVELAVGDAVWIAESKLGSATLAGRTNEVGPLGPREVRTYDLAGTRFIVVFEPFERHGDARVASIYLR